MHVTELMGQAIKDYFEGKDTEDLWNETSISEKDRLPIDYLFRSYQDMPLIEQKALQACRGTVLDIGSGAGSHSLYLQAQKVDVTALDASRSSIEVCQQRGIEKTICSSFWDYDSTRFDTLLLLMNGTGLFEKLDKVPEALEHLKKLLNPKGQILIDSSDLQYMYEADEQGRIQVPAFLNYYGELECVLHYQGYSSAPYYWLYLAPATFESLANEAGFKFEIIQRGENFDYLARLSLAT